MLSSDDEAGTSILRLYQPYGTLYVGVTNDVLRRTYQHREGVNDGFTQRYGVKKLVYFEVFPTAADAIHREKRMKKWPRQYKINLILANNPRWDDLYEKIVGPIYPPDGSPA